MAGCSKIAVVVAAALLAGAQGFPLAFAAGDVPDPRPRADGGPGAILRVPGRPDIQLPPGTRIYPSPPRANAVAPTQPSRAPPKSDPRTSSADAQPPSHKRVLDELFARLGKSTDSSEAEGIARSIKRIWQRSGSDTADLLMTRAGTALSSKNTALAEQLLDRIVALEPDWAEAWNRRATVRYEKFDDDGAMADIAQVLVREPRHFGALSGMGYIFERHDMHKAALKVFRKVLALYPKQDDIRKVVDKLTIEVEGRDI